MSRQSRLNFRLSFRGIVALVTGTALLAACAAGEEMEKKKKKPVMPGDDYYADPPAEEQPIEGTVNPDSGAFGAGSRPSTKDGGPPTDGSTGPQVFCGGALKAGDLAIVEIMVSSRSGSGDDGEWVEVRNTQTCWLKLNGVTVESTRGQAAPDVATIQSDLELPPNGTFVVAGSTDPTKNHGITGAVFAWPTTDVLKNDGDTIAVKAGGVVIDELTYPGFTNLTPGRALAFPADCASTDRSDWSRWSLTFDEFSTGFKGTPNAANGDVACY
jgi:lamin tail-like protein